MGVENANWYRSKAACRTLSIDSRVGRRALRECCGCAQHPMDGRNAERDGTWYLHLWEPWAMLSLGAGASD